ncbi:hypothetical protein Taro_034041 [Colocasia esculenta]|uniref:Uncharacterized protein n=1 Tax=Colocasia esculenta TaxID=4460 RepID=A0A843W6F8_COLES|nr:hypothetical protein [Colocasia esculenta]
MEGGNVDTRCGTGERMRTFGSIGCHEDKALVEVHSANPEDPSEATAAPGDAADGDSLQPTSGEILPGECSTFPGHDVSWPDAPQGGQVPGAEGALEFLMRSARAAMQTSNPPSIEVVRDVLQRNTLAYHLMGCSRDPWMATVDSLWGEVRRLHQEAASAAHRLRIQELTEEIASLEQKTEASRLQKSDLHKRTETLRACRDRSGDEVAALRRTIEDASKRLAECELAFTVFDRGVIEAEAEMADLERGRSDSQARISSLQAALVDLQRGPPGAYAHFLARFEHGGIRGRLPPEFVFRGIINFQMPAV